MLNAWPWCFLVTRQTNFRKQDGRRDTRTERSRMGLSGPRCSRPGDHGNKAMVHGVYEMETIIILADKRKAFCIADISLLRGGRGKDPDRATQTPFSQEEACIIPNEAQSQSTGGQIPGSALPVSQNASASGFQKTDWGWGGDSKGQGSLVKGNMKQTSSCLLLETAASLWLLVDLQMKANAEHTPLPRAPTQGSLYRPTRHFSRQPGRASRLKCQAFSDTLKG